MTLEELKALLAPIKIVKVLSVLKHPYADKLKLVVIDMGGKAKVVITGAENLEEGNFIPFLSEGNVVPGYLLKQGEKIILGKKMLRNLESDSMLLAEDEIGIGDDHTGIYIIKSEDNEALLGKSILDILTDDDLNKILDSKTSNLHF